MKTYQVFIGNFDLRFFNWNKSKSFVSYLLWWELIIGWLHIRKIKSNQQIHKEQLERDKLNHLVGK